LACITPTERIAVGIHHRRRPEPKMSASPSGSAIASSVPSSIGCADDPTARVSPKRSVSMDPLYCRKGRTVVTWSKMLNLVRCSTIEKKATTAVPDTSSFTTFSIAPLLRMIERTK
jgi:hypothetical protein